MGEIFEISGFEQTRLRSVWHTSVTLEDEPVPFWHPLTSSAVRMGGPSSICVRRQGPDVTIDPSSLRSHGVPNGDDDAPPRSTHTSN